MIESADLDARRIGSAERLYTKHRRKQQAEARRAWLESADRFQAVTKAMIRLYRHSSTEERESFNRPLSQLVDAIRAVERITAC